MYAKKNLLKIAGIIMVCIMVMSICPVFAAGTVTQVVVVYDSTAKNYTVTVTIANPTAGKTVQIQGLTPDGVVLTTGNFIVVEQLDIVGNTATKTFTIDKDAPSGTYTLKVSYEGVITLKTFDHSNMDALDEINNAANVGAIRGIVVANAVNLGFDIAGYNALAGDTYKDKVDQAIFNAKPYSNVTTFKAAWYQVLVLQSIFGATDANILTILDKYKADLGFDINDANGDYAKLAVIGAAQATVRAKLIAGKTFAGAQVTSFADVLATYNGSCKVSFFIDATMANVKTFVGYAFYKAIDFPDYETLSVNDQTAAMRYVIGKKNSIKMPNDPDEFYLEWLATQSATPTPEPVVTDGGNNGGNNGGDVIVYPNDTPEPTETPTPTVTPIPTPPASVDTIENIFPDLVSANVNWAYGYIVDLYNVGVMIGDKEGTFRPNDNISRQEYVKTLVTGFGLTLESGTSPFTDVPADAWSAPYIYTAFKAGIITGISDTEFGIDLEITRQDMCVMADRALQKSGVTLERDETSSDYVDSTSIDSYASGAIGAMTKKGILQGVGDGYFEPLGFATRAQTAKIISLIRSSR